MTRCTTLLACGWLLFTPPLVTDKSGDKLLTGAPYEKWQVAGSYDTAAECDRGKGAMLQQIRDDVKETEAQATPEAKQFAQQLRVRLLTLSMTAKCLPTDSLGFKFK
jgi:hypothetical protein